MQILMLSVSLPDDTHPDTELRLSVPGAESEVVIALPARGREKTVASPPGAADDYVLGGYAGI